MQVFYKQWDSDFFQKVIYQIVMNNRDSDVSELEKMIRDYPGALIQVQTAIDDYHAINLLLHYQFKWVNNSVDFINDRIESKICVDEIVKADASDLETILGFIPGLYNHSRYTAEGYFDSSDADRLYSAWVIGAYKGSFDDELLVMKSKMGLCGFVTLKYLSSSSVRIGLIGINPEIQTKNLGSKLMMALHSYCLRQKIGTLFVKTQLNNLRAVGLYTKLGYNVIEVTTWFYKQNRNDLA